MHRIDATVQDQQCRFSLNGKTKDLKHFRFCIVFRRLWIFVYTIQPVVEPVWQPVVSCLQAGCQTSCTTRFDNQLNMAVRWTRLSNRLYNRFHNRLYQVNKHPPGCQTALTTDCIVHTSRLSHQLYNPVWQSLEHGCSFNTVVNRLHNRLYHVNGVLPVCIYLHQAVRPIKH